MAPAASLALALQLLSSSNSSRNCEVQQDVAAGPSPLSHPLMQIFALPLAEVAAVPRSGIAVSGAFVRARHTSAMVPYLLSLIWFPVSTSADLPCLPRPWGALGTSCG